jgi:hypothetical protein
MRTLSILIAILFVTACAAEAPPPTTGSPLPGGVSPGGGDDGTADDNDDDDDDGDGDDGSGGGQNVCDVTQVSNGTEHQIVCTSTNGGPASCVCLVDGEVASTCTTSSDSACSMPGGNCCGF